jgi:dTDP-4-amino-4,6-dideoxygalactose transaminase
MRIPAVRIVVPEEDERWVLEQIRQVLRSGRLTLGTYARQFEEACAAAHGVRHAVAVSSGTAALEIILRALGAAGSEVVVPANTFFATAAAVLHAGARVRFADVDPTTFALSWRTIEPQLSPQTRGVVVVHIGGLMSPELPEIVRACAARGLWVVEDAAHAHGCAVMGRPAGSFGVAAALSFYPTKVVTAGEGGMILTNDAELAAEARVYRDQGKQGFETNVHVRLGSNWRLSEMHAILGLSQLRRLSTFVRQRRTVAGWYDDLLHGCRELRPVSPAAGVESNYYKYIVMLPDGVDRTALKRRLREEYGVSLSGEVYEMPLHQQPVFAPFAHGPLPAAERICQRHICLPIYPTMTRDEASYVVRSLVAALGRT